jgi:4-hydroxyphenylpyruvate dioxygenase
MARTDNMPIQDIDYIEFYTGNAKQMSYFLSQCFGFQPVAYQGLETGSRDKVSYVLKQEKTWFVISGGVSGTHEIAQFTSLHGDGVKDIALRVEDCERAFNEAVQRGAKPVSPPEVVKDKDGEWKKATIKTYGDTVHSFIERKNYQGTFAPGFIPYSAVYQTESTGLIGVDHVVGNVEHMMEWVKFYEDVMGFSQWYTFTDKNISTEYSALMSKVMSNGTGRIKFPINEPAQAKRKSQIEEFLEYYNGPGVQHIALLTSDIVKTVTALRKKGVEFLETPDSYYDSLTERVGEIDEQIQALKQLKILVDRDEEGYLLQIFTKPLVDRPTLFFEIIQRKGSRGFGEGNFKALFQAIEREQERRGNL